MLMAEAITRMCGQSRRWGRLAEDDVGKDDENHIAELSSGHTEPGEALRQLRVVKQAVVDHYGGS